MGLAFASCAARSRIRCGTSRESGMVPPYGYSSRKNTFFPPYSHPVLTSMGYTLPTPAAFPPRSAALECSPPLGRNFSVAATPVTRIIQETHFAGLTPAARGKVRDIYDLGDKLLIVATDRLSAFDVILPTPIPDKGRVLTQLSLFWFDLLKDIIPNHVLSSTEFPAAFNAFREELEGRSMVVRKTQPLPIECVVRGYVSGSGWKDYQATGKICGISL